MFADELSGNIRSARQATGMTQGELAQKVGVTDSCISQYETSKRMPSLETMSILSDILNTSLDDLIPKSHWEIPKDENQTDIFDVLDEDDEDDE